MQQITEIRGKGVAAAPAVGWTSPYTLKAEIDLGLAIGEACRILAVYMNVKLGAEFTDAGFVQCILGLSFDPNEVAGPGSTDSEIFAVLDNSIIVQSGTAEAFGQRVVQRYYDFGSLYLITTRNVGIIGQAESEVTGDTPEVTAQARVYYERFTPGVNDLNRLIATRR